MAEYEVEVRCFVGEAEFEALRSHLGRPFYSARELTYYMDARPDTRLQITSRKGKIWQKAGMIHEEVREEISIELENDEVKRLKLMLERIGHRVAVMWFRTRRAYRIEDLTVTLDDTVGYGKILEIEGICTSAAEVNAIRGRAEKLLCELGIRKTERADQDREYESYVRSWPARVGHLDESWVTAQQPDSE